MIETLRQEWKPEMAWEQVIALRDCLDAMLKEIRFSRGIRPPTMSCPVCKRRTQQAPASVSVRATILALGRFSICRCGGNEIVGEALGKAPQGKQSRSQWQAQRGLIHGFRPSRAGSSFARSYLTMTLQAQRRAHPSAKREKGVSVDGGFTLSAAEC